jgi:subtilase family serine protease
MFVPVFLLLTTLVSADCNIRRRADGETLHTFSVGLANRNIEAVYETARKASDPLSPSYGKFWTWKEVVSTTSDPSSLSITLEFLASKKIEVIEISQDNQWVTVRAPLGTIETIFDTQCFQYQCEADTEERRKPASFFLHRCDAHHLPESLRGHVDIIGGLVELPTLDVPSIVAFHEPREIPLAPPSEWPEGPYLNMSAIQILYNVDSTSITQPGTSAAVFEVNAPYEYFNPPDLASFQILSRLPNQPVSQFSGSPVTFGCPNYLCAEPVLDVEMVLGMAPSVNFTYWTTVVYPPPPSGNVVLEWLISLASTQNPSWIHSISWGPPESDLSPDLARRMDEEFAKLALRGLTFVTSSGDDGVNFRAARTDPSKCGLDPQYPAGSPWVTTVGGTFGPEYGIPERTCQVNVKDYPATITSGGGFSKWYELSLFLFSRVAI